MITINPLWTHDLRSHTEKKIDYNNLDSKIWHSIFIWLQQPVFGCDSKFLVVLAYQNHILTLADRLTKLKICCYNQKLVAAAI